MSTGIASKGVDLASIFSPYQSGTTQARATGIYDNGADLNTLFAALQYGSAVPATGIYSESADLNTIFCTGANYALPINGETFNAVGTSSGVAPIKLAKGTIQVQIGGGQYVVQTSVTNNGASPVVTNHTFTIPSGMNYFYLTFTNESTGIGGSITPPPAGWTAIPGSLTNEASVSTSNATNNGTQVTQATANLYFGASSGATIWSGSFVIHSETDISA